LRLLILVAREGFLKDKCGPRAKRMSTTGVGAGKYLRCEGFCPNFLKLARKMGCGNVSSYKFSIIKMVQTFLWRSHTN